ncbi:DndE family protein [Spirosoma panaciterrae]|uniref:DndE family protein n=1 Tax=Spirosoma panaciterrae TaxID=496058 RepID=UPI0003686141|nr:DndE family protein [Spirosoma panaciterrae]
MFNSITTSEANKVIITELTNKFSLGTENIIARLAFAYSIAQENKLDLKGLQDAKGKTYPVKILFGNHLEVYIALICQLYQIHKSDKDIPKYIKLHLDHGLHELKEYSTSDGTDFLLKAIESGIESQLSLF